MSNTYTPIDCNFYDRLEAWSTLRQPVTISYQLNGATADTASGKIVGLYIKEKVEYLLLDSDFTLRLDAIISIEANHVQYRPESC